MFSLFLPFRLMHLWTSRGLSLRTCGVFKLATHSGQHLFFAPNFFCVHCWFIILRAEEKLWLSFLAACSTCPTTFEAWLVENNFPFESRHLKFVLSCWKRIRVRLIWGLQAKGRCETKRKIDEKPNWRQVAPTSLVKGENVLPLQIPRLRHPGRRCRAPSLAPSSEKLPSNGWSPDKRTDRNRVAAACPSYLW